MDLIFKRYSSPYLFLDELIINNMFSNFIDEFIETQNNEMMWEFFLHKVYDKNFEEFKKGIINSEVDEVDIEATVQKSFNILKNFVPDER